MGAVFTITLFLPVMIPMFLLEKLGIDVTGIIDGIMTAVITWVKANPETATKIGDALESLMGLLIDVVDKLNIFQI